MNQERAAGFNVTCDGTNYTLLVPFNQELPQREKSIDVSGKIENPDEAGMRNGRLMWERLPIRLFHLLGQLVKFKHPEED